MTATRRANELTSNRVLGKSAAWTLAGQIAPIILAVLSFPYLIQRLGTDRFGTLTLVWVFAGYLGFLDLGLGTALTKYAADLLAKGREDEIAPMAVRALWVMLAIGACGGLALFAVSPWLARDVLHSSASLTGELEWSIRLVALMVPIITMTAAFNGLLAAYQRFDVINAIGMPLSALSYAAPLLVALAHPTLPAVVASLVVIRVAGWVLTAYLCRRYTRALSRTHGQKSGVSVARLLAFGGWVSVASVVGPVLVYVDRFLMGAWVTMTEVAYYTTPYSVVTRVLIFPAAAAQVLFPAFAATSGVDAERFAVLVDRGVRAICLAVFPLTFLAVLFARPALDLWLGRSFASGSFLVLQVIAFGVFVNSPAVIPGSIITAVGRPDLVAKLYLAEVGPYVVLLWVLARAFGIEGVAAAWAIRCACDAGLLLALASHVAPEARRALRRGGVVVLVGCVPLALAFLPLGAEVRVAFGLVVILAFALAGWRWLLHDGERRFLRVRLGSALRGKAMQP
jgi:O-antigen/teichoic acid export membrane protein